MESDEQGRAGFRVCDGKGFQIRFKNGWTLSVQFGQHNYCENRYGSRAGDLLSIVGDIESLGRGGPGDRERLYQLVQEAGHACCANAEIAIWPSVSDDLAPLAELGGYTPDWVNLGGDKVAGYVSADAVGRIIAILQASQGFLDFNEVQEAVRAILREEEEE
tara:strand:+ start:96 stop:581 length:486 start_codon:yes stop_codon:yes gene_type:complete